MSHPFHYFTPGISAAKLAPGNILDKKVLPTVHLAHLAGHLTRSGDISIQDAVNLGGHQGAFFTPTVGGRPAEVVTFNPDESKQRWLKTEKLWIGWEVGNEPGPDELQRKEIIPYGYQVPDTAGRLWLVPIARSPDANKVSLPCDLAWDIGTGEPREVRKKSTDWIWDLGKEISDVRFAGKETSDPNWLTKQALRVLQINYALGPIELEAFREMGKTLIDSTIASQITLSIIDFQVVTEVDDAKKNEALSQP